MLNIVTTSTYRNKLWTSANLIATGCATTTNISSEIAHNINFNVYPNPAQENTIIKFNLIEKQKVEIKIYNLTGQEVSFYFEGELNSGEYEYPLNKNKLSPGMYFIRLTLNNQSFTNKMIVE